MVLRAEMGKPIKQRRLKTHPFTVISNTTVTKQNPTKRDKRGVKIRRTVKRSIQGNAFNPYTGKPKLGAVHEAKYSST
jgi:hypothetical protein